MNKITDLELLNIYDELPSLLDIAEERVKDSGDYVYGIQDDLREKYRLAGQPFRWSMPFRSIFSCIYCSYANTQVKHVLENPAMKGIEPTLYIVELSEEDVHKIREHGIPFSAALKKFLTQFTIPPR